jgi:D-serine deaminase-like pyridoxal phosphate-dependent protein
MILDEIQTPALLLDRKVLLHNLDRIATRAQDLGVSLRPHVKTHKCVEVARLQQQRGAVGLTVSTLAEADALAAAGFDDLTWAFPLPWDKIPAALSLARRIKLRLVLDDPSTLETLEQAASDAGLRVHTWLKVDCGYHRAGVDPDSAEAVDLPRQMARSASMVFDGLLTHAGHAYGAYERQRRLEIARQERDALVGLAGRLRSEGLEVRQVSVGSTPTFTTIDDLSGVTEARPGNYAYFDLSQVALGSCTMQEIAVSVLATVVSRPTAPDRAIIDAGALAMSKDVGPNVPLMGAVCPDPRNTEVDPSLRLEMLTQEHGVIRSGDPGALRGRLPVGSRVRVLPNHSCLTNACFDSIYVIEDGQAVDCWKIHRER